MQNVDYIGSDAICELINSGYQHFVIYKNSEVERNTLPLYQFKDEGATSKDAQREFLKWSKIANTDLIYVIFLYENRINVADEDTSNERSKSIPNNIKGKLKCTFALEEPKKNSNQSMPVVSGIDYEDRVNGIIKMKELEWENTALKKQVEELENELEELTKIGDVENVDPIDRFERIFDLVSPKLDYLFSKINGTGQTSIAGTNHIEYLRNNVQGFDMVMAKLAELHKTDTDKFNQLLTDIFSKI